MYYVVEGNDDDDDVPRETNDKLVNNKHRGRLSKVNEISIRENDLGIDSN